METKLFSTMEAVYNMGMKGISCEIDEEYFEDGKKRIESLPPRQGTLFEQVVHNVRGLCEVAEPKR